MRPILGFLSLCTLASSSIAQSNDLRFEVVAIKLRGQQGAPAPGIGEVILPGGVFRDPATTLRNIIETAYDFHDLGLKIIGLPKWAEAAVYSFNAKAGPDYPANISPKQNEENVKAMLRSMLADRFQLKLHQEDRAAKVLVLQVKAGRSKLTPVPAPVPPEKAGWPGLQVTDRGGFIRGKKVPISRLTETLTLSLKQRVEDRTGLTGFYDFDERWDTPRGEGDPVPANTLGPVGLAQLSSILD